MVSFDRLCDAIGLCSKSRIPFRLICGLCHLSAAPQTRDLTCPRLRVPRLSCNRVNNIGWRQPISSVDNKIVKVILFHNICGFGHFCIYFSVFTWTLSVIDNADRNSLVKKKIIFVNANGSVNAALSYRSTLSSIEQTVDSCVGRSIDFDLRV